MGLSAWEQQALNSIKSGIAGSDPELAALLSGFSRLASGEEMPDRERVPAGPRRLRRTWQRSSLRRACQRLGFQRAALLSLWVLTTAALIAVALVFATGGDHGSTCTGMMAMACTSPAPGHSPSSSSPGTTVGQVPQQPASSIPQAGP
jgi:hypothetical protein